MAGILGIRFIAREEGGNTRWHNTDDRECWCRPTYYRVCDCEEAGCWKCSRGKIEVSLEEVLACPDEIFLIVHADR